MNKKKYLTLFKKGKNSSVLIIYLFLSTQIAFLWLITSPVRLVSWMLSTPLPVWSCSTSMCLKTQWWPSGTSSPSRSKGAHLGTAAQTAMWQCKTMTSESSPSEGNELIIISLLPVDRLGGWGWGVNLSKVNCYQQLRIIKEELL